MTTEMVASTLAALNVSLKSLQAELHELNAHLDELEDAVGATDKRLRDDGVQRMKTARALFPDLQGSA